MEALSHLSNSDLLRKKSEYSLSTNKGQEKGELKFLKKALDTGVHDSPLGAYVKIQISWQNPQGLWFLKSVAWAGNPYLEHPS